MRQELVKHLALLRQQGLLRIWHRGDVIAGDDPAKEAAARIDAARIILVLVSADYLDGSEGYEHDLPRAVEKWRAGQAAIVPILLKPCDWQSAPFAGCAVLPSGERPVTLWAIRDEAWEQVAGQLRSLIERLTTGTPGTRETPTSRQRSAPLYFHPLPHEPDFQGRSQELDELEQLYRRGGSVVAALVGIGGTGKSVLLPELLRRLDRLDELQPDALFVWSFAIDQDTDRLLTQAYRYLTGHEPRSIASMGHVYAVAEALRGAGRAVLVLDGLERAQRDDSKALGNIEDAPLRLLLELVAQGCGRTFILATSRLPLSDLRSFRGTGYHEINLEQLAPRAAAGLLKARGVRGEAEALEALALRFGYHALTLSLLGAALLDFFDGDLACAPQLLASAGLEALDEGGKLGSLLDEYERRLGPEAVALLERMSAFSGPVRASLLESVFLRPDGGQLAGPLARLDRLGMRAVLARLQKLRLIGCLRQARGMGTAEEPVFWAHAAIKEHFYRRLFSSCAVAVHAAIRDSLSATPMKRLPERGEELDLLEELIHHTMKAGGVASAWHIYMQRLGSYEHLGARMGEYARGARIARSFFIDGDPKRPAAARIGHEHLATDVGLFLSKLGELGPAAAFHQAALDAGDPVAARNLCKLRLLEGRLHEALSLAERDFESGDMTSTDSSHGFSSESFVSVNSYAYRATALALLGDIEGAEAGFARALAMQASSRGNLVNLCGVYQADLMLRLLDLDAAQRIAQENLRYCEAMGFHDTATRCHLQLSDLWRLRGALERARDHLESARAFASSSGWQEALALWHLTVARIFLQSDDARAAAQAAQEGLGLAERCGFGLIAIDALTVLGGAELVCGQVGAAERTARDALARSMQTTCGYAWGQRDAADLLGRTLLAGGRAEEARTAFAAAPPLGRRLAGRSPFRRPVR